MRNNKIGEKILQRCNDEFRKLGHTSRSDLSIIDFQAIDDGRQSGRVLLRHAFDMEPPTAHEVEAFFRASFGNEVQPRLESMATHSEEKCVSLVASLLVRTRPITDADTDDMVRMTPTRYMDANSKNVWDVTEDEAGRKHLILTSESNLSEIVEARRNYRLRSMPKLSQIKSAAVAVSKGDHVMFFDNGIIAHGEVTSVGKLVSIDAATGSVSVDPQAILKITQKSPEEIASEKDYLENYFAKAYGDPEFAQELTRTTVSEETGGKVSQ